MLISSVLVCCSVWFFTKTSYTNRLVFIRYENGIIMTRPHLINIIYLINDLKEVTIESKTLLYMKNEVN